jgi:hypothetical protein
MARRGPGFGASASIAAAISWRFSPLGLMGILKIRLRALRANGVFHFCRNDIEIVFERLYAVVDLFIEEASLRERLTHDDNTCSARVAFKVEEHRVRHVERLHALREA